MPGARKQRAETTKVGAEHSMSRKGDKVETVIDLIVVSVRCAWRKLDCLNPSPQGYSVGGDVLTVETSLQRMQ